MVVVACRQVKKMGRPLSPPPRRVSCLLMPGSRRVSCRHQVAVGEGSPENHRKPESGYREAAGSGGRTCPHSGRQGNGSCSPS